MSKHTPGPWVTQRDRDPPNRPQIATVAWVGDWCVGISTPGYPGGNYRDATYGTNEADARLIAAAPELLEALRECSARLSACRLLIEDDDARHMAAESVALARAAIAKATGSAA